MFLASCGGDDPKDSKLSILTESIELMEGNETNSQVATFELNKTVNTDLTLSIAITGGDAIENEDFTSLTSNSVTLTSGENSFSITIEVLGDLRRENDEEIQLSFTSTDPDFEAVDVSVLIINDDADNYSIGELVFPEGGYETPLSYDGMKLVWSDEFDQESLNLDDWSYDNGNGCPNICGWGNNELQYYMDENLSLQNGYLVIEAKKQTVGGNEFTSAKIVSKGKQSFTYGRIDIRANLPYGQGIWPALWMLGDNIDEVGWPNCGEIDIMEMVGGDNVKDATTHGTVHWGVDGGNHAEYGGSKKVSEGILNDNFHVFSIEWDENAIIWYIDDQQYHAIDITPESLSAFDKPFYFIINVAVGGNWPGNPSLFTVLPQYMIVDYIRVFQPE